MKIRFHHRRLYIEVFVQSKIGVWIAHSIDKINRIIILILTFVLLLNYLFTLKIGWLSIFTLLAALLNLVGVEPLNPGGLDPEYGYAVIGINTRFGRH
jgi:hypothetical protein